jgi:Domain of unknown function (DUF5667)
VPVTPRDRRLADDFALAVDHPGATADAAVVPLLDVAASLRSLAVAAPAPATDFRDALRQRLLATAIEPAAVRVASPLSPAPLGSWRRRLVAAGAGVTMAAAGMGGVAVASSGALPGDARYGVKRTVEDVRLSVTWSDQAKGERYLQHADTRLDEVERVLGRTGPRPADPDAIRDLGSTLDDMSSATEHGSKLLTGVYERSRDEQPLEALQDFTREERARLQTVQPLLPSELQRQPASLLALLGQIDSQIARITGRPVPPGAVPGTPGGPGQPGRSTPSGRPGSIVPGTGAPGSDPAVPGKPGGPAGVPGAGAPGSGRGAPPAKAPGAGAQQPAPGTGEEAPADGLIDLDGAPGEAPAVGVNPPPALPVPAPSVTVPPLVPGLPGVDINGRGDGGGTSSGSGGAGGLLGP